MNAALFTKSSTALILTSGLIAASSVLAHAQDATVPLGAAATSKLSASYTTVPAGQATLGGHTFDMTSGNMLGLNNGASASFAVSYQSPTAVHLLLNTANTSNMWSGSTVGTVVLTFSDNTTQTANLTVGSNIREWLISAFGVVTTVSDITANATNPYVTQAVWTSTPVGGTGTAVLDMVSVPVLSANTSKTLTGVQVSNINTYGSLWIDLSGLTVQFTPPAPPAPAPGTGTGSGTGTGTGSGTGTGTGSGAGTGTGSGTGGIACGNSQAHVDSDKAEKSDVEKADKSDVEKAENDDHDCHKAAVKSAGKKTTEKSDKHERNDD
jgi:hypothetical protein